MVLTGSWATQPSRAGTLELTIVDEAGKQVPCRVHLHDETGTAQSASALPFWNDHFVCPGFVKLDLPPGKYDYEIERGPEYRTSDGSIELNDQTKSLTVKLNRIADLAALGWYSGELHVHRPIEEMPLHLRAEDLHVAPVITWWNDRNHWRDHPLPQKTRIRLDDGRYFDVMAGEDEREGGALLYFGLPQPLPLPGAKIKFPEHPSPLKFVEMAREHSGVWIDLEKPFWWDTPIWLASGQVNSIGLANNHMQRRGMTKSEAWGRARDAERLPPPRGTGYWTQEIYYHALNCGLRIPPSAGSASGVLPNPVGYNRCYVYTGSPLRYDAWWEGLRAGRSFVTNGPLLLCQANQHRPGHVFKADANVQIDLDIELISAEHVPRLEVIRDGRVDQTIALDRVVKSRARTTLHFEQSGWFLVRAIAENPRTFRFASTAPYFVEIGNTPHRISLRSVEFFLEWLEERAARVPRKLKDPKNLDDVLKYHHQARPFWQQILRQANAP